MSENETDDWGCFIAGCSRQARVRGLCRAHYIKKWRNGELPPKTMDAALIRARVGLPRAHDRALRKLARSSGQKYSALVRLAVKELLRQRGVLPEAL